ncbi:MAG: DUF547 domain-containing protein [Planctomycetota bacterium]
MPLVERRAAKQAIKAGGFKVRPLGAPLLVSALALLILATGCPPREGGPGEAPGTEPNIVEPRVPETGLVEPGTGEPNALEPEVVETNNVQPGVVDLNTVEPSVTEPAEVEPNESKQVPRVTFHDKCSAILDKFVDHKGMVDYQALKRERLELKALLDEFAKLDRKQYESWPREDKIAFWINAYNVQMLSIITDNYPIESFRLLRLLPTWGPDSIRHIDKKIGGIGSQKFSVMNEVFTLDEVENRFFREEFGEPRVFLAAGRATLDSPSLRKEPYHGYRLYEQLEDQTKRFLSTPRAFSIDRQNRKVYVSSLFSPSSYGKDFVRNYRTDKKFKDQTPVVRAVLNFISRYVSAQDVLFIERQNYSVKYIAYDWRINDSAGKQ